MAEGIKRGRKPGTKNAPKNDKNEEVKKINMTSSQLSFADVQKKWNEIFQKRQNHPFSGGNAAARQASMAGFINNPFMNKNPFINKNNPLTNGGIPVTFYSYDPSGTTNMTGQDQTNNNLLNNSKMMETNYPNNLLNYEDYGAQPIINSKSKTVGNYQNLNLLQGKY